MSANSNRRGPAFGHLVWLARGSRAVGALGICLGDRRCDGREAGRANINVSSYQGIRHVCAIEIRVPTCVRRRGHRCRVRTRRNGLAGHRWSNRVTRRGGAFRGLGRERSRARRRGLVGCGMWHRRSRGRRRRRFASGGIGHQSFSRRWTNASRA